MTLALLGSVVSGGCATLGYYAQAVGGHYGLTRSARPVESLLADPDTPRALRQRLLLAREIVEFAAMELGVDASGGYADYVALDRPHVVWNLFAAPPLSLEAHRWCYPVIGCAPYRGYFSRHGAEAAAARLSRAGFETHVAGVPAYSTLGWFDDPLLSTFIFWPQPRLVELLVHETAHRRVWARGDVAFNESFAEFAGRLGARRWFRARGNMAEFDNYQTARRGWQRLNGLLLETRQHLEWVYAQGGDDTALHSAKAAVLAALRRCYQADRARLGDGAFDHVVGSVNNAYLVALGTYADWRPALAALYRRSADWQEFLAAVDKLAALDAEGRVKALRALAVETGEAAAEPDPGRCDFLLP